MADIYRSPQWTIITVSFNSADVLREYWSTPPAGVEWIVVDNASSDDSRDAAAELGAQVIPLGRNVGFGRANNVALRRTQSPYVIFANPDARVVFEDLPLLADVLRTQSCFVAPQLLNVDGTVQRNGRGMPFVLHKFAHRGVARQVVGDLSEYARDTAESAAPVDVAWVMGAVLAGRTEDFLRIGGWDERFFIYYEDHEMGFRAWEDGIRVLIDPRVRWTHGWARATMGASWRPWLHEVASACRFYRKRPDLLSKRLNPMFPGDEVLIPGIGRFVRRAT